MEKLSQEQIKLIRQQIAADLKWRRNRITAGFLIMLAGVGFAIADNRHVAAEQSDKIAAVAEQQAKAIVQSGRAVAVGACNDRFVDRDKFRGVFIQLRKNSTLSYQHRIIPKSQYEQAVLFYNRQLKTFEQIDCRVAQRITANPSATALKVPEPFYPGNPNNPKP